MVTGLFKSSLLHLLILIMFLYGAEIFRKNKKFEIIEIPLDIIDISEKTITAKQRPSPPKKNTKQTFSPPKALSKPKLPEFVDEKKTVKKKNKKKKEEEKKIESKADSILKSIEKIKTEQSKEREKIEEVKPTEKKIASSNIGEKLTISEKDAIRRQFYSCWIVPAGAKNIKNYKVSIKLSLDRDGEVIRSKLTNSLNNQDTFLRTLAESAMRAVNHPNCKKLKVPKRKYETWKEMILDFDPSLMVN